MLHIHIYLSYRHNWKDINNFVFRITSYPTAICIKCISNQSLIYLCSLPPKNGCPNTPEVQKPCVNIRLASLSPLSSKTKESSSSSTTAATAIESLSFWSLLTILGRGSIRIRIRTVAVTVSSSKEEPCVHLCLPPPPAPCHTGAVISSKQSSKQPEEPGVSTWWIAWLSRSSSKVSLSPM